MVDVAERARLALMALDMQSEEMTRNLLRRQDTLASARAPWEQAWRDVDRRVNPGGAGGFGNKKSPGAIRGLENFDSTAPRHLSRATAALASVTIPENQIWHGIVTTDLDLNKLHSTMVWCEIATSRVFACRYNALSGFGTQATEDLRQSLSYGTAPLWIDEIPGAHLFYKSIHMSQCYIDENFAGRVDTTHRKYTLSLRQAVQEFGEHALPDRLQQKWADEQAKCGDEEFEFLHVLRPNGEYQKGMWGPQGKKIESITIAIDDKWVVRRKGYFSNPLPVSRHMTSTGDKYGTSPSMEVMGTIKTLNEMGRTILTQAQKAVDPAWALSEDLDLSVLATKPNGLNPGLLDDRGEFLAKPLPVGGDIALGLEMVEQHRADVKSAFLEDFFKLLTDPSDRMTATQVIETMQKQGVLISPYAGRYNTEKLAPMVERELELLMSAGQIPPMPPEMVEAGARLRLVMSNPIERMARAEEAGGFARWAEMAVQLAAFDEGVIDVVDTENAMRGLAEVLGVRPSWINSPEKVAERRAAREEAKQQQTVLDAVPGAAGAALDLAKANDLAQAA